MLWTNGFTWRKCGQRGKPYRLSTRSSVVCRQHECDFKRPGQFWSQTGDEGLMCLETFRRSGRWQLLFPQSADPSKN